MSSTVDICNLALGYLGDDATVASLDPPEGSAQADHCARFYPIARDIILNAHKWDFITRRTSLALLSSAPPSSWRYAYAMPADVLDMITILAQDAADDNSVGIPAYGSYSNGYGYGGTINLPGVYTPQPFVTESDATGATVIYTNQMNAVLRYTARITDSAKFPPLVVQGLAMLLASMLAGPVLKGKDGMQAAALWLRSYNDWLKQAKESDANQQRQEITQSPSWIANR